MAAAGLDAQGHVAAGGIDRSELEVRRGGVPISLTSFDTAIPGWAGPGGTAGAKVVGSRLALGPGDPDDPGDVDGAGPVPQPSVDGQTVVLRPEGGGRLATTVASDPERARAQLDAALPRAT